MSERWESNPRLNLGKVAYCHYTTLAFSTLGRSCSTIEPYPLYKTMIYISFDGKENQKLAGFEINLIFGIICSAVLKGGADGSREEKEHFRFYSGCLYS